jgi:hypothetical protein
MIASIATLIALEWAAFAGIVHDSERLRPASLIKMIRDDVATKVVSRSHMTPNV